MPDIRIRWADNTKELTANLKQGLNQIEATKASAEKMVKALSGDNLIRAAHNYVAAVDQIGGAGKLSAEWQERINTTVTKAIEQYKVLGKEAPEAMVALANATKKVEPPASSLGKLMGSLKDEVLATAAGFVSAQAIIGGVQAGFRAITGFVSSSVESYAAAEAAQRKLTTALKAQSTATPEVIEQYNQLAAGLQQTTVYSDDLINEMQALLVQVGDVMPSQMAGALRASTDLASGLGIDLQTATNLVAKAAGGHTEALGRYGIQVSQAAMETEGFTAVLDAIQSRFGGQAASEIETYAGRVKQMANAWDNVKESVGQKLLQDPLVSATMRTLADDTKLVETRSGQMVEGLKSLGGVVLGLVNPGLADMVRRLEELAGVQNLENKLLKDGEAGYKAFIAANMPAIEAQRILAEGMAESARLSKADEQAKKDQAEATKKMAAEAKRAAEALKDAQQKIADIQAQTAKGFEPVSLYAAADQDLANIRAFLKELDDVDRVMRGISVGYADASLVKVGAIDAVGPAKARLAEIEAEAAQTVSAIFARGIQSIPDLLQQAFTGGGKVLGAIQAFASKIGGELGGKLFAAGGPINGLGNKLAGIFGDSFGLALPGIGQALGALVGPIMSKLYGAIKRAFGGPSEQELEGRSLVESFEQQFASTEDMISRVGDAYRANGKTAEDAQAAIQRMWAAEKQGAEATRAAIAAINEELKRRQEIDDAISGQGFKSQDQIRHEADIANEAYKQMLAAPDQYTDSQIESAYRHYQELLAQLEGAAGDAARAWLEIHKSAEDAATAGSDAMRAAESDLKASLDKRAALKRGLDAEAAEAEKGVIEQQQEEELKALDQQIQEKADAYAKLADETGQRMADAIVEALRAIQIEPIHVPIIVDGPGSEQPDPAPVSRGGQATTSGVRYFRDGFIPLPRFAPIGTDTIPAMLTPGEMVLTASQQRAVGSLIAQGAGAGSAGRSVSVSFGDIHVQATGADLQDMEAFVPKFKDAVRRDVDGIRTMLETVAG